MHTQYSIRSLNDAAQWGQYFTAASEERVAPKKFGVFLPFETCQTKRGLSAALVVHSGGCRCCWPDI